MAHIKANPQVDFSEAVTIIERVEKLQEDVAAINADISEIWKEAKDRGFNVSALKEMIRLRKMDENELDEKDFWINKLRDVMGV